MRTRQQEFQEVRRLLRYPKHGRPGGDALMSALIREEQSMLNRTNASGKGWSPETTTFTTSEGTADYTLSPSGANAIGKPIYAYRDLGDGDLLPVNFADFQHEIHNQNYDFWMSPVGTNTLAPYSGEKLGFFREGGTQKVKVYPVPDEVKTYTIIYAVGWKDWSNFTWSDVPELQEWSFLKCLKVAGYEAVGAEWEGLSLADNIAYRKEIRESLAIQIAQEEPRFEAYIRNPHHEVISDVGGWWE